MDVVIFSQESHDPEVVVPGPVVREASFGIPLTACEGIPARGDSQFQVAPGVVAP